MVILITYINCMREGISQYKLYYSGYVFIGVVAPVLRHFVLHKHFLLFFSACLVAVCLVFSYLTVFMLNVSLKQTSQGQTVAQVLNL